MSGRKEKAAGRRGGGEKTSNRALRAQFIFLPASPPPCNLLFARIQERMR
jgi:hypothetical protein